MVRDARLKILLVAGAAIALAAACASGAATDVVGCTLRSVDKASYVAKNEALLRGLPVVPGARVVSRYSLGQTASDSCLPVLNGRPYEGFTTTHAYETARPEPPGAILRYYRRRLLANGWKWIAQSGIAGPAHDSAFRRGPAVLYVMESSDERAAWTVTADHAAYSRLKTKR